MHRNSFEISFYLGRLVKLAQNVGQSLPSLLTYGELFRMWSPSEYRNAINKHLRILQLT